MEKFKDHLETFRFRDSNGNIVSTTSGYNLTSRIDGPPSYPPGGNCDHIKWDKAPDGVLVQYNANGGYPHASITGNGRTNFYHPYATRYLFWPYVNSLNWKKLATSNEAGLLQNIAELDDTVAMFGKKLLSSLSYGGYKWGWGPLLSDVAAVNDAVNNTRLSPPGLPQKYHDVNAFTIEHWYGDPDKPNSSKIIWDVKVMHKGTVTVDMNILSYYDFLGFHPSPKLVWDLVPLSFAVDWVLPIGDALDNCAGPKGWVQAVSFTGWRTVKARYREEYIPRLDISSYAKPSECTLFERKYLTCSLETKTIKKELGLKWPTFSNILDYGYLANSFSKKKQR